MSYSREPWTYEDHELDCKLFSKYEQHYTCTAETLSNAERIVACINACAGIPDEELDNFIFDSLNYQIEYRNANLHICFPPKEWMVKALEMRQDG